MNELIGKLKTDFADLDKKDLIKRTETLVYLRLKELNQLKELPTLLVIKQTDVLKLLVVHH